MQYIIIFLFYETHYITINNKIDKYNCNYSCGSIFQLEQWYNIFCNKNENCVCVSIEHWTLDSITMRIFALPFYFLSSIDFHWYCKTVCGIVVIASIVCWYLLSMSKSNEIPINQPSNWIEFEIHSIFFIFFVVRTHNTKSYYRSMA